MANDDNPYLSDSNYVMVGGQKVGPPAGVSVLNYQDPTVFRFKNQPRPTKVVSEVIVHETVTRSWQDTVRVLQPAGPTNPGGRGLGVHFIAAPDGTIYQHGDLLTDELWHASQHNPTSVGIETVNPYDPHLAPANGPWKDVIQNAPWAAGGKYLVPTPEQSEAVCQLVGWLCGSDSGLSIPQLFVGLQGGTTLSMGPLAPAKILSPGIYAHHYFGHADGAWLVMYTWLRLVAGKSPEESRSLAIQLATGAHAAGVDLSPYVPVQSST